MEYIKSKKYDIPAINSRIMGPNPLKLQEELLIDSPLNKDSIVLDLGSGQGVTSLMLAKEYGCTVYAADLWSDPGENMRFFESMGLSSRRIIPLRADATALPFATDFFDAVVSTDSYNYFGRDKSYLDEKLLPFLKPGGCIYVCVPGMHKDLHDALPPELLLSWTPEQLDFLHDADYWRNIVSASKAAEIVSIGEMESNEEVWADWLACDNDYALGDRRTMEAGAGKYLSFVSFILKKRPKAGKS